MTFIMPPDTPENEEEKPEEATPEGINTNYPGPEGRPVVE